MATNSSQKLNRRGVATLEFVMALPLLFVLMICILWEGHWLIGQAEVIVEARNNTWKKRFDNLADNPLSFPILPDYNLPVLYHKDADYAHEKASTKVDITPAFNAIPGPEAANFLLAGSWDSQAMPLDKPPDFVLMGKAALIGAFGNVLGLASSLDDPLGLLGMVTSAKNEGANVGNQIASDQSSVGESKSGDDSGSGSGSGGGDTSGGKTTEQAKQDAEKDLEDRKKALIKRFQEIRAKTDLGLNRVVPAGGDFEKAYEDQISAQQESDQKTQAALIENDKDRKKQLQEEAARAHRKLELARISFKRLESEAMDIVKEADALDLSPILLNGGLY